MSGHCAAARRGLVLAAAALCVSGSAAKDLGGGWNEKKNNEGKVVQELKIEAPAMTEEDQYGYVMPDRYKCDSCRAVMFHLDADLRKKHPKSRRLKQWEYTDIMDNTCRGGFEGYGIKLVNGENKLSGPGLKMDENLAPGSGAIQMGGETWSKRLGEICRKIVYEKVGEDEVYDMFYRALRAEGTDAEGEPGLSEALCTRELRECHVGPPPPPKAKAEDDEKAQKAKADKAAKKAEKAKKAKDAKAAEAKAPAKGADARRAADATPAAAGDQEKIDVQAFLRQLAVSHGLTSDEYLAARTATEWEKLTVAIAGRIFNRIADAPEGTCKAR